MPSNLDPKEDYIFKKLFGDEANTPLLVDLLNAVVAPPVGAPMTGVQLSNPYTPQAFRGGKVTTLDIFARDDPGRGYHLEMQRSIPWFYPKRQLYYWAVTYHTQLALGEDYGLLVPVHSITFLDAIYFRESPDWRHRFGLRNTEDGRVFCSDLDIQLIELPKFNIPAEEIATPLEAWCYFLIHGADLDPNSIPTTVARPMIRRAVEVLMEFAMHPLLKEELDDARRLRRDQVSTLNALARSQQQLQEADRKLKEADRQRQEADRQRQEADRQLQEANQRGPMVGQILAFQSLLGQALTDDAVLQQMSLAELAVLADQLRKQFPSKPAS
jgi:predicted transposase/invertase (TIGR01784 family)